MPLNLYFLIITIILQLSTCTVYYVNPHNPIKTGGGKSWNQAFTNLDKAIIEATKLIDEIWLVYNYTYIPSTTNRMDCFNVAAGVKIYGGFL